MRKCGILLPISSIPSKYGIGTFSKEAYEFVDFLETAGQKLWQILPLGPTGYGDSPYQSFSTFAGNPYLIDLEKLIAKGWISEAECDAYDFGQYDNGVDYEKIYLSRFLILKKAYERSEIEKNSAFQAYVKDNAYWLEDYALYMSVKKSYEEKSWLEWDEDIKLRKAEALIEYRKKFVKEMEFYKFQQYLFMEQWENLKAYANQKGIEIIGDIPIYVALDSADTWANPELFQLDQDCNPIAVAGCPPDAFSATGQLWGNPLYKWEYHKETEYVWWVKRMKYCFQIYDVVRIDHFRGFDEYYSIPYGDKTAEAGKWCKGPGYDVFRVLKEKLGDRKVIAEDLGYLTDSVVELVERSGYPGMKVLQFAFDSREASDYLPHNYGKNCVVYTGTHDNDTTLGWYLSFDKKDQKFANAYMDIEPKAKNVQLKFVRAALSSVADTAVIPMQDYLGLGSEARINMPSTLGINWMWRLKEGQCTEELALQMQKMSKMYGRI